MHFYWALLCHIFLFFSVAAFFKDNLVYVYLSLENKKNNKYGCHVFIFYVFGNPLFSGWSQIFLWRCLLKPFYFQYQKSFGVEFLDKFVSLMCEIVTAQMYLSYFSKND